MTLTFREALRGYVGQGADHAAGFADGRRSGGALSFRALATIDDLATFETDPMHTVALAGEIDYAPLGGCLPFRAGTIHLLVPHREGWRLLYRLPFEGRGRRCLLVGEKRIPKRPGFRDFTTLYTELFGEGDSEGSDSPGELLARGQLRVPFGEALRFPFTLRVPGHGAASSLRPALRFFLFVRRQMAQL
ncbi:MAG: hypothetical protein ACE5I7_10245 [Candidatus Binatia bacterium]